MTATVIEMPATLRCDSCGRACGDDELSTCDWCGERFCGSAKSNCKSECVCDRFAAHVAQLISLQNA